MESFQTQAKELVSKEITANTNLTEEETDIAVKGALAAMVAMYRKNNGVPPIPFPISLSTVDMICICHTTDNGLQIMLGRKPGQEKWQFPGGFRDPKETSRQAAARELSEEATLFNIDSTHNCYRIKAGVQNTYSRLESIDELFVDDVRYRNTPHKITTHVFLLELTEEEMSKPKPGDDLGEIKWYSYDELKADTSVIRDIHIPIFNLLVSYLG
jgi:8-oxo-dGTP pyrophosphatase MutT (NUDIX family)